MPAKKSPRLHILNGNPGRRPINTPPQPRVTLPRCPAWLSEEGKKLWHQLGPELVKQGLITHLDAACFACFCEAYSQVVSARRILKEQGETYKVESSGLTKRHPAVVIAATSARDMLLFAKEFGCTPLARQKLDCPIGEDAEKDDLDEFLRGSS